VKSSTLLLAGSLFLNVALVALFAFQPVLAPPALRGFFSRVPKATLTATSQTVIRDGGRSATLKATTAKAVADAGVWESLQPDDLKGLVARLRAAGFPASVIRSVVSSLISARFAPRYRELMGADPNTPFWKVGSSIFGPNDTKRMEQYQQLNRDRSKLQRELLGDDLLGNNGEVTAAQRRQFGDLARSKIDLVQRISDDYAEMTSQVRAGMQGITLPEDREKLALLNRERHADLAAVLTPEELAEFEMRASPLTSMMRSRLGTFEPSDAEFRAIYQVQQSISDQFAAGGGPQGDFEMRRTLGQQYFDQMKSALGPARYAEYDRSQNRDFQQLSGLAQRANLSPDIAIQAFNLRDTVATQSNQIFDDPTLSADQKRAALASLAQNTRTQLLTSLGPTVGPAYVDVANQWLNNIERGSAVSFNGPPTGTMSQSSSGVTMFMGGSSPVYKRLPPSRPSGAAPPPPVTTTQTITIGP
jgi:hypothetical protein